MRSVFIMKRHLFSFFVLCLCAMAWMVVLRGGLPMVEVSEVAEEEEAVAVMAYVGSGQTHIRGVSRVTLEEAREWAIRRGATEEFVAIAAEYWRLGELMGIRPDVMYAQAAKETAFGRFGGAVTPDQNNWAGVKTEDATGDEREDHQSFDTPEAGVLAHFNHMAAYVGVEPIGELHPRFHVVMRTSWAGTIMWVEELGGRWAPALDYGESIVRDFMADM